MPPTTPKNVIEIFNENFETSYLVINTEDEKYIMEKVVIELFRSINDKDFDPRNKELEYANIVSQTNVKIFVKDNKDIYSSLMLKLMSVDTFEDIDTQTIRKKMIHDKIIANFMYNGEVKRFLSPPKSKFRLIEIICNLLDEYLIREGDCPEDAIDMKSLSAGQEDDVEMNGKIYKIINDEWTKAVLDQNVIKNSDFEQMNKRLLCMNDTEKLCKLLDSSSQKTKCQVVYVFEEFKKPLVSKKCEMVEEIVQSVNGKLTIVPVKTILTEEKVFSSNPVNLQQNIKITCHPIDHPDISDALYIISGSHLDVSMMTKDSSALVYITSSYSYSMKKMLSIFPIKLDTCIYIPHVILFKNSTLKQMDNLKRISILMTPNITSTTYKIASQLGHKKCFADNQIYGNYFEKCYTL